MSRVLAIDPGWTGFGWALIGASGSLLESAVVELHGDTVPERIASAYSSVCGVAALLRRQRIVDVDAVVEQPSIHWARRIRSEDVIQLHWAFAATIAALNDACPGRVHCVPVDDWLNRRPPRERSEAYLVEELRRMTGVKRPTHVAAAYWMGMYWMRTRKLREARE